MKGPRHAASVLLLATAMLSACGRVESASFGRDASAELDAGRRYATALLSSTQGTASASSAIEVGYLERTRLGLGSPFRLMEYALEDPRLGESARDSLAWALMAGTVDGAGYRVDPRALAVDGDAESGARHLALIEGAIRSAADPRSGELALRLAYAMAAAEQTVPEALPLRAAHAAALLRDRAVSRADARRLLESAQASPGVDPLSLLSVWRVSRLFRVEAPAVSPVPASVERDAIALAPRLLREIRSIQERPRVGPVNRTPAASPRPLLSEAAAERLSEVSAAYDAPPETPVVVALLPFGPGADSLEAHFFARSVNEERLAAEYALLSERGRPEAPDRLAVLSAAVALRAYGQERPWFPGFGGPADRDLENRFGLASVVFPRSVPASWRPYYRRMLESALSDLERVLPSLNVGGLHVRFEPRPGSPGTLAVHDPRTRTLYLPPATGAGTIAHEMAHDLDWQTALRRYRVRGDYATDRAMRLADGRFARVLRGLTTASLAPDVDIESLRDHATRPAEVFARNVDWFVAVSLAREGRTNGYLSSVEDGLLTGYGTARPPDVTGRAGEALMTLLDNVAPVYPETRSWYLQNYGRLRVPSAYDLVRRVLEAPLPDEPGEGPGATSQRILLESVRGGPAAAPPAPVLARLASTAAQLRELGAVRDSALAAVDGECTATVYGDGTREARRDLVRTVAGARARGLVLSVAGDLGGLSGWRRVADRLDGHSSGVESGSALDAALESLVSAAAAMPRPRVAAPPPLQPPPALAPCPALSPFMSPAGP